MTQQTLSAYEQIMAEREQASLEDAAEKFWELQGNIGDISAGFPDEDCLQDIIDRVAALSKCVRGDNRAQVLDILEMLESKQLELSRAAEYGLSELRELENLINQ